jgi:hypothetical protein
LLANRASSVAGVCKWSSALVTARSRESLVVTSGTSSPPDAASRKYRAGLSRPLAVPVSAVRSGEGERYGGEASIS